MKLFKGMAFCALVAGLAFAQLAAADINAPLTAGETSQLNAGQQVFRTEAVQGSDWPQMKVYQLVRATPEEAAAVFTDYGSQTSYLRDCCNVIRSEVVDQAVGGNARVQRVDYEIDIPVPFVPNEKYELIETTDRYGSGYIAKWQSNGSPVHARSISGWATFTAYGSETLMTYFNFTNINAAFEGQAEDKTKNTVTQMVARMGQMHNQGGQAIQSLVQRLRAEFNN